jgi:chorismate dehydratase
MTSLSRLRVGRLPYLNALPFAGPFAGAEPRWVTDVPRRLGEHAAAGRLDAALLASRDALALADRFRPLADLGIACRGPVTSVLLLSHRPVRELDGATVALTSESRTSRGLLRILLGEAFGVRPRYAELAPGVEADARLAIGDVALALRASGRWPFVLDLGAAWADHTGLPFVYARWVVRRDLPPALERALATELGARLDAPLAPLDDRLPAGMTPAAARAYLARFAYRLGPAECAGLRRFHTELIRHDLLRHHRERARIGSAA